MTTKAQKKKERLARQRIVGKAKVKLMRKLDPVKAVMPQGNQVQMVREGKKGHFQDEYEKETKWLGKSSL